MPPIAILNRLRYLSKNLPLVRCANHLLYPFAQLRRGHFSCDDGDSAISDVRSEPQNLICARDSKGEESSKRTTWSLRQCLLKGMITQMITADHHTVDDWELKMKHRDRSFSQ